MCFFREVMNMSNKYKEIKNEEAEMTAGGVKEWVLDGDEDIEIRLENDSDGGLNVR